MKNQSSGRSRRPAQSRNTESGSALVIVLLLAIVLAGMGAALVATANSSSNVVRISVNQDRALMLADSVMTAATNRWARGEDPVVGDENSPLKQNAGSFWITSSQLDPDTVSLIATAKVEQAVSVVEVVMQQSSGATPLFGEWGVFARKWVEWSNNGKMDSYDPSVGYSSTSADDLDNASMRTNYSMYMTGGSTLYGDVTLDGPANLANGARITGMTIQEPDAYIPPPLPDVPTYSSEGGYLVPYGSRTITGNHAYDFMRFNGGSRTTIVGPATLTTGDFYLDQGSQITADTTLGPVTFHVSGEFLVNNGTRFITTNHDPESLRFFISTDNNSTGEQVAFQGGASLEGFIFAPNTDITVDNGTSVFGAIAAARLTMRGGAQVHQDVSLSTFSMSGSGGTQDPAVLMWRTISPVERDALLAERN